MSDILEPKLIWIDGRCYRQSDDAVWSVKDLKSYVEENFEPVYEAKEEGCGEDADIEIVPLWGNRLKHSFHVNSHFFRFIIGSKGTTLKRLEDESNTTIKVPRQGQSGDVVITGANHKDIISARTRIDILIETSRSKIEFTHFISIPANFDEMKRNFEKFKEDVINKYGKGVRGVREEMFIYPETLHLTVIMLVLLDEDERKIAIEALQTCKTDIIMPELKKNGPIEIEYRGVEIMNDDPSEVEVLFIKAEDENGRLQKIADDIANYFINKGLARRQYDKVKLHTTVINTNFLLDHAMSWRTQNQETFDASNILKEHKDTYFGKTKLSSMHLSLRHSSSKDGYWTATAEIEFKS